MVLNSGGFGARSEKEEILRGKKGKREIEGGRGERESITVKRCIVFTTKIFVCSVQKPFTFNGHMPLK